MLMYLNIRQNLLKYVLGRTLNLNEYERSNFLCIQMVRQSDASLIILSVIISNNPLVSTKINGAVEYSWPSILRIKYYTAV